MSYEGYREFLCHNGHYDRSSAYDDVPSACRRCGQQIAFWHPVDGTNGVEEDNPGTMPAPKEVIAEDDVWHVDHHGNRYATKLLRYKPLNEWRRVLEIERARG